MQIEDAHKVYYWKFKNGIFYPYHVNHILCEMPVFTSVGYPSFEGFPIHYIAIRSSVPEYNIEYFLLSIFAKIGKKNKHEKMQNTV